jgi:hypothetical protein
MPATPELDDAEKAALIAELKRTIAGVVGVKNLGLSNSSPTYQPDPIINDNHFSTRTWRNDACPSGVS